MDLDSLKVLTNDTLKAIRTFDIVTPELFQQTFLQKAQEHKIVVDLEELAKETQNVTLHQIYEIEKETRENTHILQHNIDIATHAIDSQDKNLLLQVQEEMAKLQRRIATLEQQIYLDELTKAYNRKWLFEKLLIDEKFPKEGAIAFVDIDKFKAINDSYGHITGDKILAMLVQLIKAIHSDDVIRYGGDEFLIIGNDLPELQSQMEKLTTILHTKRFKFQGKTFMVHISYGIDAFQAGVSFREILEKIDQKMYRHKAEKVSSPA